MSLVYWVVRIKELKKDEVVIVYLRSLFVLVIVISLIIENNNYTIES